MNVDDELRAAGRRLRDHTAPATPDLDAVHRGSAARRRQLSIATTLLVFVLVAAGVTGASLRRGTTDAGIDVFGSGGGAGAPSSVTPPQRTTTTSVTAPPHTTPGAAVDAIGGGAPCDAATFGSVVADRTHQTVTRVERFACINNWASARIATTSSGATTFLFHIELRHWVVATDDIERDGRALQDLGAPIDALYRVMGLIRSPASTTTTTGLGPPLTVVEVDAAQRPPAALLGAITRTFLADIGDPGLHDSLGTSIRVFDGFVLSTTTMRTLDDDDRAAVRAALTDAGFTVEFIPYVVAGTPDLPTLVLADPAIHRDPVPVDPGTFAVYAEISGCGQSCGYGADYLGRADEAAGWVITPVVDASADPPVTPTPSTEPPPSDTVTDPASTTTTVPLPDGVTGGPTTTTLPPGGGDGGPTTDPPTTDVPLR